MKESSESFTPSNRFIEYLPNTDYYEISFQHKDLIKDIHVSNIKNMIITISDDGFLKMWKKGFSLIEYIKTFKAHIGTISNASFSKNHEHFYTTSLFDKTIKVFDMNLFDLQSIISLDCPLSLLIPTKTSHDFEQNFIGFSQNNELIEIGGQKKVHQCKNKLVEILLFDEFNFFITLSENGFIEYHDLQTWNFVTKENNKVT